MAPNWVDEPLSMNSRGTLAAAFPLMGVTHSKDDVLFKDQINILGWLSPNKGLDLASCQDQESDYDTRIESQVAGDVEFNVSEGPQETVCKVKDFLDKEVVAEVTHDDRDPQKIEAVVFVDFVALQVEVDIISVQDHTTIMVTDRSRRDVVRLHRFCEQLKDGLGLKREQTQQNGSTLDLQPELLPMSFDEFEDDWVDSQCMSDKAEALLNDVTSRHASMRVEGAQVLASWAQECPECREHIAEAMLKHDVQISEALLLNSNLPLAEAYPLAATLQYTLLCPNAASKLRDTDIVLQLLAIRTVTNGSTAAIVAKALSMAAKSLDKVTP